MLDLFWLLLLAFSGLVSSDHVLASGSAKNIFLLAGQSNMAGRGGEVHRRWDRVVPPECHPYPSILRLSTGLSWEEACEPLHKGIDATKICGVGPGMPFAHYILDKEASLGVVGLVPCAIGGTKVSQWAHGTYLYNQLVRRAKAALHCGGTIKALLWYQDESDIVTLEDAKLYKRRLEKFITDLRHDLQSPTLPVIQIRSQLQVALASGEESYIEEVREAQLGIDLPNVRCVDAKGLQPQPGNLHISTFAQVRLGEMLANAYLQTLPPKIKLSLFSFRDFSVSI